MQISISNNMSSLSPEQTYCHIMHYTWTLNSANCANYEYVPVVSDTSQERYEPVLVALAVRVQKDDDVTRCVACAHCARPTRTEIG